MSLQSTEETRFLWASNARSDHLSLPVYQCWNRTRLFPGASSSNMDSWSPDYAGQVAAVTLPPTPLLAIFLFITKAKDTHTEIFFWPKTGLIPHQSERTKFFKIFKCLAHGIPWNWYILVHLGILVHVGTGSGGRRESSIKQDRRDSQVLGHSEMQIFASLNLFKDV